MNRTRALLDQGKPRRAWVVAMAEKRRPWKTTSVMAYQEIISERTDLDAALWASTEMDMRLAAAIDMDDRLAEHRERIRPSR